MRWQRWLRRPTGCPLDRWVLSRVAVLAFGDGTGLGDRHVLLASRRPPPSHPDRERGTSGGQVNRLGGAGGGARPVKGKLPMGEMGDKNLKEMGLRTQRTTSDY